MRSIPGRRSRRVRAILCAAAMGAFVHPALATTDSWNGGNFDNWTDGTKWSLGLQPAAGQDAVVNNAVGLFQFHVLNYNYNGPSNALASLTVDCTGAGTNQLQIPASTNTLTVAGTEYIGAVGSGVISQGDGTNTLTGASSVMWLGASNTAHGSYALSGGLLTGDLSCFVGIDGVGNFNQSGGVHTLAGGSVYLAYDLGSTGTYTLSSGTLSGANSEWLGIGGVGTFNQSGGTNSLSGVGSPSLNVGEQTGGSSYNLSAGLLTGCSNEFVGYTGSGVFNQSGGTNTLSGAASVLYLGQSRSSSYTLTSGLLNNAGAEIIGQTSGYFTQTGGTNSLTGTSSYIALGTAPGGTGAYALSGGTLSTSNFYVGGTSNAAGGIGTLDISGSSSFTVGGSLKIYSKGKVTITGPLGSNDYATVGNLQITSGLMNLTTASMTIDYGTTASPNSSIRGYISNGYHGASLWAGTNGITSSSAAADPAHFSVAYADGADGVVTHLPAGESSFAPGGTLASGAELVTYARAGDGNLDGKVDFADFIILSNHFGVSDTNWDHGNFNYDAIVDFADFIILSNDFGAGVTGGNGIGATPAELAQYNAMAQSFGISQNQIAAWDATISSLPEPASAGLFVASGGVLLLRRRKVLPKACRSNRKTIMSSIALNLINHCVAGFTCIS